MLDTILHIVQDLAKYDFSTDAGKELLAEIIKNVKKICESANDALAQWQEAELVLPRDIIAKILYEIMLGIDFACAEINSERAAKNHWTREQVIALLSGITKSVNSKVKT